jgi:YegS/Rv2252/BmrU family lipid kinase
VREGLRGAGWVVDEHLSEGPGHAIDLAAATHEGCGIALAVGGDGTANEVVNGLVASGAADIPLGIVPLGTANDFARCLGIPGKPEAATRALLAGHRRRIDLGRVSGRYFINVAGVGFDASVAHWVNRRWKHFGMYVVGVFRTLAVFDPVWMRLELDGTVREGRLFLAAIGNTSAYGGGLRICPHAEPDDGWLDVVTIGDVRKYEVFSLLPRLYSGAHLRHRKVATARVRALSVTADPPQPVHVDGEPVGHTPVAFSLEPGAIEVVTPPGPASGRAPRLSQRGEVRR